MNHIFWNESEVHQYNHQLNSHISSDESSRWIKNDLVLGNAKAGCRGAGICQISMHGNTRNKQCSCSVVTAYLARVNPYCLQLIIDKRSLTFQQRKQHFLGTHIELAKKIKIPASIAKSLGYLEDLWILPRSYPLQHDKHFLHHFLDCQREKMYVEK